MRVLVCGSREYENFRHVNQILSGLLKKPAVIIHGAAPGVDTWAGLWARNNDITEEVYPADWDKYGKAAGPIRNKQMLTEGQPEMVVAFRGPNSRGTQNMITQARKAGIETVVVDVP